MVLIHLVQILVKLNNLPTLKGNVIKCLKPPPRFLECFEKHHFTRTTDQIETNHGTHRLFSASVTPPNLRVQYFRWPSPSPSPVFYGPSQNPVSLLRETQWSTSPERRPNKNCGVVLWWANHPTWFTHGIFTPIWFLFSFPDLNGCV